MSDADCSTIAADASISSVRMAHAWVRATIAGGQVMGCAALDQCYFDPSYKTYTWKTGIGPASAMGLVSGKPLQDATTGGLFGGYSSGMTGLDPLHKDVPYVKALNVEALNGDMQTYSSSLLSYIQSHHLQGAQMEDIIGGGVLVPSITTTRQAALPYADPSPPYTAHVWIPDSDPARYNAIPDQYRTTLEVNGTTYKYQTEDNEAGYYVVDKDHPVTMFDPTLFVDEIYGRRLTIETNFDQQAIKLPADENEYYNQRVCLALDVVAWSTWSDARCLIPYEYLTGGPLPPYRHQARPLPGALALTANHPYAAAAPGGVAGSYMDAVVTKAIGLIVPLTIVHGWGDMSPTLLTKWSEERAADTTLPTLNIYTRCHGGTGEDGNLCGSMPQPTGNFTREKVAAGWLAQFSRAARLNAQLADAVPQVHHALGVVAGEVSLWGVNDDPHDTKPGFVVNSSLDSIDIDGAISFSTHTSTASAVGARRGAIRAFAAAAEMFEGSISSQQSDLPDNSSTATRFEWGNRPPMGSPMPRQNPYITSPQEFFAFDGTTAYEAYNGPGAKLVAVDGGNTGGCSNGSGSNSWGLQPTFDSNVCEGLASGLGGAIAAYAGDGFKVYASKEAFLGPGQRGGSIIPILGVSGLPSTYTTTPGSQRGGAFVAVKSDGDEPVEIAHVITGSGGGKVKGGGGGTQPDINSTYDPATAADILKSHFVDRSNALGVNLANGSLGMTSPVSIDVGNGGFPYQLSASLSWHPGPPSSPFAPSSPIAPSPGWSHSWKNSLSLSASGLEAMGASDIRAAVGAIVAFVTAQDIYQSSESAQREVAGILTQSWLAHQTTDNVASVNIGGNTRQFVKLPDGSFIASGPGFAKLEQHGARLAYEETCFKNYYEPPYAQARGWDWHDVSFDVTGAQGDVQHFGYFENPYINVIDDNPVTKCGRLKGFRLTNWAFPYGMSVTPTYTPVSNGTDIFDELTSVANVIGRSLTFTHTRISAGARHIDMSDGSARPAAMTDAMNKTTGFTYRTSSVSGQRPLTYPLLASITAPDSAQHNTDYGYDGVNRIMSVSDAVAIQQGTRGPYQLYIADGTRGERDDPLGQPYTVVYDTYGHPSRYLDEVGHETQALFDSRGRAVSYTYPEGDCEAFAYDDRNNTTDLWMVDKASTAAVCNTAAGAGHVLRATAAWHPLWNKPTSVTNFRGKQTTLDYYDSTDPPTGRALSLLQTATRPAIDIAGVPTPPIYQFAYDAKGRLTDATGPTGIVAHNGYDGGENLTSAVSDYGHLNLTTAFGYDAIGNVTSTTDPRTNVTTSLYDDNRRKCEDDHHAGGLSAGLNAASRVIYDTIGRVTDEQAGTGFSSTPTVCGGTGVTWLTTKHTTYTPTSKIAAVTDADNRTTASAYDDGDRILTVTDPIGRNVHYRYCGAGVADCAANAIRSEYRGWQSGNACSQAAPSQQQCYRRATYTPNGQQKTLKDANGNTTTYDYDGFDRLVKSTLPDGTYEQLTPDQNGNITARRNRAGQTLAYTYNDLDWLTEKVSPSPAVTTDWTYLLDGRVDTICTTSACSAAGDVIDYNYDGAGRLKQVRTKVSGITIKVTNYEIDPNGNRTKLEWSDGYFVGYCYDSLNRMTAAMENATSTTNPACDSSLLATYTYDAQSRPTNLTYAGNKGQMSSPSPAAYSAAGDLLSLQNIFPGSTASTNTFSYAYTNAHQTLSAANNKAGWMWVPGTTGSTGYTTNNLNQYPAVGSQTTGGANCQGAAQGQSYDCKGNLTFDGTYTFGYDAENRLVTASKPGLAAAYQYDPLGRRTRKSGAGVTDTVFLSDGPDEIAEYDPVTGSITRRIVPGPGIDQPIALVDVAHSGAKTFFHTDKQGSVVALSDGSGAQVEGPYTYDPYGNCFVASTPCAPSATQTPYLFTGRRWDAEIGCYYYRARYYCADEKRGGRFLQIDTAGYDAGLNLYTYGENDSVNLVDPDGQAAIVDGNKIYIRPENQNVPVPKLWLPNTVGAQGISPANTYFHTYLVTTPSNIRNPGAIGTGFILNPTPGNDSPATTMGTRNNVGPLIMFDGGTNYVKSFAIPSPDPHKFTDMIINYTVAGEHTVEEGFVMGYGAINPNGTITLVNYGEGNNIKQNPWLKFIWGPMVDDAWHNVQQEIIHRVGAPDFVQHACPPSRPGLSCGAGGLNVWGGGSFK